MSSYVLEPEQSQEVRLAYLYLAIWAANIHSCGETLSLQADTLNRCARELLDRALQRLVVAQVPRVLIEKLKLAVICTIDELANMAFTKWSLLQGHYYQDAHRGTSFFNEMEQLRRNQDNVLFTEPVEFLELYLFCLSVGYQGGYGDDRHEDREELRRNLEQALRQRLRVTSPLAPHLPPLASTQEHRPIVSWLWISVLAMLIPTIFIVGAYKILDHMASSVQQEAAGNEQGLRKNQCQDSGNPPPIREARR